MPEEYEKIHIEAAELKALYSRLKAYLSKVIDEQLSDEQLFKERNIPESERRKIRRKIRKIILKHFLGKLFNSLKYSLAVDDNVMHSIVDPESDIVDELKRMEDTEEKTEPYDFALNDKLRSMYFEVENMFSVVAKLRKNTPGDVYKNTESRLQKNDNQINEIIAKEKASLDKLTKNETEASDDSTVPLENETYDDLLDDYETSLSDIASLKKKLPSTLSQLDNLISTVNFLNR